MKFVVIVEPDEVHASRIRAILEGIDKNFEYVLVDSAEEGIDEVENRETDVFIGSMEMPVLSGTELFGVIEMISPETVRIVMTEGNKIMETVSFMNECKTFKIIIKPCQVADDLIAPIDAAIAFKEMHREGDAAGQTAEMRISSMEQEYLRLKEALKRGVEHYERAAGIFAEMIACNLTLGDRPPEIQRRLAVWYRWMIEEYETLLITGGPGYEAGVKKLMERYHIPEEGCTVQIRRISKDGIGAEQMSYLFYLMHLMMELCRKLLLHYQISVTIGPAQKAHILRFHCGVGEAGGIPYREKSRQVRAEMIRASERGMEALGYRAKILPGEDQFSISIAVMR